MSNVSVNTLSSLFRRLAPLDRQRLMATVPDFPASFADGWAKEEDVDWFHRHAPTVVPSILQVLDLRDEEVFELRSKGLIRFWAVESSPLDTISVRMFGESSTVEPSGEHRGFDLSEVAAGTSAILAVATSTSIALRGFVDDDEELRFPKIELAHGSVEAILSEMVGGGILLAGVGLLLAVATGGIVPAAAAGFYGIGGAALTALGTVKEIQNIKARQLQNALKSLEIQLKQQELAVLRATAETARDRAELELHRLKQEVSEKEIALSRLLRTGDVKRSAAEFGISEAAARHLTNRCLTTAVEEVAKVGPVQVTRGRRQKRSAKVS